jgi:beta-glucosidase/6-phospho-beta-glucosidase/beta-galactosidase/ABC-type amino acid transport substrate-binding protein
MAAFGKNLLSRLGLRRTLPPLPESFLFGVGNSDHQCEAYDPAYPDIHDVWDPSHGRTPRGQANDFWNRYPEDIRLAQSMGCKLFRFSLSWARIEPAIGQFNPAAIQHYREVVETIQRAGMQPCITLHHFVWPMHIEKRGGMTAPDFPAWFAHYAAVAAERIGGDAPYWITFNEPSIMIFGYLKPWWQKEYFFPPGQPPDFTLGEQMDTLATFIRNLFLAHTAARREIRKINPSAKVGTNPSLLGLPTFLSRFLDRQMTNIRTPEDWTRQGGRLTERAWLENGKVDVVLATLTKTAEREREIDFTQVYFHTGQAVMVRNQSPIQDRDQLGQKRVAVVKTSTAEEAVRTVLPLSDPAVFSNYTDALQALDAGRCDALLADEILLRGWIHRRPGSYRIIANGLTDEPYAAAVLKGNPRWVGLLDSVIQSFRDSGRFQESLARNLPDLAPPSSSPRTGAETPADNQGRAGLRAAGLPRGRPHSLVRTIQNRGHLLAAVRDDVPGFGFRDPVTGEWSGLEIDLARAVAQRIFGDPERVVFQPVQTRQRIPLIRSIFRIFDPLLQRLSILSTAINSDWWHLGMAGRLPTFLCPAECVGQQDFVGFDYYWGISTLRLNLIQRMFDAVVNCNYSQAPVWPAALYNFLKSHAELFPGMELVVVENGCVDEADGVDRGQYLRRHIREMQRARQDGINVAAYICWSLTTNWEWGAKYDKGSDFGLYHIDLGDDPDLKRIATPAAETYRKIIRHRGEYVEGRNAQ